MDASRSPIFIRHNFILTDNDDIKDTECLIASSIPKGVSHRCGSNGEEAWSIADENLWNVAIVVNSSWDCPVDAGPG